MNHLRDIFEAWVALSILTLLLVCLIYFAGRFIRAQLRSANVITAEELNRERVTVLIPLSIKDLQ